MYVNTNYKHSEITDKIIGAAINVHKHFGCGFQEIIYQRAMAMEFDKLELYYIREATLDIIYESKIIGSRRVDFLVKNKILVELKAIEKLENVHIVQTLNYLKVFNLEVGLLLNFGAIKQLEIKRLIQTPGYQNKPFIQ